MAQYVVLLIAAFSSTVLPGCLDSEHGGANPSQITLDPDSSGQEPEVVGTVPSQFNTTPPTTWTLADCVVWTARFDWYAISAPGPTPAGWDSNNEALETAVFYDLLSCAEIILGPFQRGPIEVVFESVSRPIPPDNCMSQQGSGVVLSAIGTSDPDVTDWMRTVMGFPAHDVSMVLDVGMLTAGELARATVELPPSSALELVGLLEGSGERPGGLSTWGYWDHGSGVAFFRLQGQGTTMDSSAPVVGSFEGAFLQTEFPGSSSVGIWGVATAQQIEGTFERYGGYECEQA